MYERYPDSKQENILNPQRYAISVGMMNFETRNQLILDVSYNKWDKHFDANITCINFNGDSNLHESGLFVEDFIRNTECLESAPDDTIES